MTNQKQLSLHNKARGCGFYPLNGLISTQVESDTASTIVEFNASDVSYSTNVREGETRTRN